MKKKYTVRLLFAVLILLIMPFCGYVGVNSGLSIPPRNPSIPLDAFSTSESSALLTWTSRWQNEPQLVENGSTLVGDHIIIESTWDSPTDSSGISFNSGSNETRNGTAAGPLYREWPDPDIQDWRWETFEGVNARDEVRVVLNLSQNGDPGFDVYSWNDFDSDNEVDPGEFGVTWLAVDDGGMGDAEEGSYISKSEGPIAIRVFCWVYAYSENMTYELQVDTKLSINIDNDPSSPEQIVFDTYDLMGNVTVNITLFSWNATNLHTVSFMNVRICNYFEPIISDIVAHEIESYVWNISWSCSDKNENDTNYYSFWLSGDSGVSYQLLVRNLTQTHFVWDSTGYSMLDTYRVRIRAFSLDFTFGNYCSTASPPGSYWPGDSSDAFIAISAGDVHSWPPGFFLITFDEHPDIEYQKGATGNVIEWVPIIHYTQPLSIVFEVYCNNTLWTSGEFYPSSDRAIEVNVDGLDIGAYEFRIEMDHRIFHSVFVSVHPRNNTNPLSQLIHYGAIGISIGSSLVIIMVIVMTIRTRASYYSTIPA